MGKHKRSPISQIQTTACRRIELNSPRGKCNHFQAAALALTVFPHTPFPAGSAIRPDSAEKAGNPAFPTAPAGPQCRSCGGLSSEPWHQSKGYPALRPEWSAVSNHAGNNFVICDDHGWPLHPDGYNKIVKIVGQKAGIGDLHPHMFRHTFVSLLMSNPDIGVATVAAEAGHAQPSTTLMIYTQQYKKDGNP